MSLRRRIIAFSPLALALSLVACGDGSSVATSNNSQEPLTGAANGSGGANTIPASLSVSGRVADGYISGATVCVDINENDACDPDEPSGTSGAGGTYDLEIPADARNKPIVAAIPADAIDEDTGEAVGQSLVFIAPADKPEFLSPITTLVHQELRANPALDVEDAERAVKTVLGIDEDDVSLFTDYVANGVESEDSSGNAERFRYLHDTARVVASLMKDIETQVESAAVSKGVDVVGDPDTQRAIRDIVRSEVRDLLPQIARQVAEIVENSDNNENDGIGTEADRGDFDPQVLAESLRPSDAADNVQERIEAARVSSESVGTDLKRVLSDGVYWMEFDCYYDNENHYTDDVDHAVQSPGAQSEELQQAMDTESYPMPVCDALYGQVELDADGDTLVSEQYRYEKLTGGWEPVAKGRNAGMSDYSLVDGQWVQVSSEGPDGQVTFAEDGSAIVSNDQGTMHLKAVTQMLDGTKVMHHLLEESADPIWIELTNPDELFSTGALTHKISVRQTFHPYVMFNHPPYEGSDSEQCAEFNGNCNVVEVYSADGQPHRLTSLQGVREQSLSGIRLRARSAGFGGDAMMEFKAQSMDDGTLPTYGEVQWISENHVHIDYSEQEFEQYMATGSEADLFLPTHEEIEGCKQRVDEAGSHVDLASEEENGMLVESHDGTISSDLDYCKELLAYVSQAQDPVDTESQPKPVDQELPQTRNEELDSLHGRWELVEVQGVEMIEVKLPLILRHGADVDTEEAILLIEHEGLVRMGARLPETYIDRVFTYNENALITLRSIVETGISNQ